MKLKSIHVDLEKGIYEVNGKSIEDATKLEVFAEKGKWEMALERRENYPFKIGKIGGVAMNKQQLTRKMEQRTGCAFINKTQLRKFTGYGKERCSRLVRNLEHLDGHTKRYLCEEVAEKIIEEVRG